MSQYKEAALLPRSALATHEVHNQPTPRTNVDLWQGDALLRQHAAHAPEAPLAAFGAALGAEEMREAGRLANRYPPELVAFDRTGRRLDEVRFHESYHRLMDAGLSRGIASAAWTGQQAGHSQHAAMVYMMSQIEPGVVCPMVMTYAAVPALAASPALEALWRPKLTAGGYDARIAPVAAKSAATLGMAMTEKQGGSDVRANTTRAEAEGAAYRLRGHKWFCSAPMSDGFLTLAQAKGGLTCFLVPRWLESGARNGIQIMRLKDKLGNKANASSEIEYHDALAYRLGEEGQGVKTIIEMVHHTRLSTAVAPAGLMRGALAEALWWAEGRSAFQRRLIDQPLMRAVLADMALDLEGTLALAMHMARAFDEGGPAARALARVGVALSKYLGNKLCPNFTYEAMECLGGVGYTEETPMPFYYREAPLNSIWEGSGNVICLDVLRALQRDEAAGAALAAELEAARGGSAAFDAALAAHRARWPRLCEEGEARSFTESLASLLTASVLLRHAPSAVAEAYAATRLGTGARGRSYGTANIGNVDAILERLRG